LRLLVGFILSLERKNVRHKEPDVAAIDAGGADNGETVVLYGRTVRPRGSEHKSRWLPIKGAAESAPDAFAADFAGRAASHGEPVVVDMGLVQGDESTPLLPEPPESGRAPAQGERGS
jgi:hypothetical protein